MMMMNDDSFEEYESYYDDNDEGVEPHLKTVHGSPPPPGQPTWIVFIFDHHHAIAMLIFIDPNYHNILFSDDVEQVKALQYSS